MKYTKLKSPVPRDVPLPYETFHFKKISVSYLPKPKTTRYVSFYKVLEKRESRRDIRQPLLETEISKLLWSVAKTKTVKVDKFGRRIEHRNTPSAGGIYPIDIFIIRRLIHPIKIELYNSYSHSLSEIPLEQNDYGKTFVEQINRMFNIKRATVLIFAGQFKKTLSKYKNGESLIWRDVGALLENVYLVSAALNLSCCALGPHFDDFAEALNCAQDYIFLGGCILGRK
ncbi:MAG: SagB/ThcOx family dehydrogenase [Ignavibacteria bacterium]|jgi:SagB-type dehydrogenase family enzyme|nr:SagB/ThcOx family dehydrogenase [Ignavibacteria bacterium]MCU7503785.1 SagB/ThcOx family dehydrogenase [Ignavibacteria bacterium]MCU7517201.1 SagB/ThcOx family dehydrogenase [Ignavibacteria bacterium]